MRSLQVLVVDDEAAVRQVMAAHIERSGNEVEHVGSGQAALERLAKGDIDVALCDIRLPDISGIEVLRNTQEAGIDTVFLMMTAYASVSTAIDAMKAGAADYLIKPVRTEDLAHRISQVAEVMGLREENRRLRRMVPDEHAHVCKLSSVTAERIERLVSKVAPTDGTVLVTGESGTGKGVIAKEIHHRSLRSSYPFVHVNCGAIPENLLESEFFGHLKGAFTGADRAKKGLFREADGGTLFLDEISELPLSLQVKLLHAIEEKMVRPVGGERPRKVDVRIIAATNRDLAKLVQEHAFREDLYYRLDVFQIQLPRLRERAQDIEDLIEFFLGLSAKRLALPGAYRIEPEAKELLLRYRWPGNMRELQNVIDRALILADSEEITVADLPSQVTLNGLPVNSPGTAARGAGSLREQTRQFEVEMIRRAIQAAGGDRQAAAASLGIGLSTLYRKLEEDAAA